MNICSQNKNAQTVLNPKTNSNTSTHILWNQGKVKPMMQTRKGLTSFPPSVITKSQTEELGENLKIQAPNRKHEN